MAFVDVDAVLVGYLADLVGDRIGTVTPSDLTTRMPFIRVTRYGGADGGFIDFPEVAITVFAGSRVSALATIQAVQDRLLRKTHRIGNASLTGIAVLSGPFEVASDDPNVRQWTLALRIITRLLVAV